MKQTDDEFIDGLIKDPAYEGVDVAREILKMKRWLSVHPGRRLTRRFMVNWLNKCEPTVQIQIKQSVITTSPKPAEPHQEAAPPPPEFREMIKKIGRMKSC